MEFDCRFSHRILKIYVWSTLFFLDFFSGKAKKCFQSNFFYDMIVDFFFVQFLNTILKFFKKFLNTIL